MVLLRGLFGVAAVCGVALGQAPTAPVVDARGVTNLYIQDPAPGTVGLGGLVQINGLNLGPVGGATAAGFPWPARLADVEVTIGGKAAPLYSVSPATIVAQVPADANTGLVNVIVKRDSGTSPPAKVIVAALDPAIRTAGGLGFGAPWGSVTADSITIAANGLGPVDDAGAPKADLSAYVGGLRAQVTAKASDQMAAEFQVQIAVPKGARAGDLITLVANRQAANLTSFGSMDAPEVQALRLPDQFPDVANLVDAGVNGSFLVATAARGADGCYPAVAINLRAKSMAVASDCLTSAAAAAVPAVAPNNSDAIGALIGPPSGDAQSGISSTVKIFSAAGDPLTVTLPSPAATLSATATDFTAVLPGQPVQIATIDAVTGDVQTAAPPAAGGAGTPATIAVNVNGLTHVLASTALGQGRTALIVADDDLKPAKAEFAIVNRDGDVLLDKPFPDGYVPLLPAVAPARAGQPAPAPPREPSFLSLGARVFVALARAADASHDAFVAFPLGDGDPKATAFPDGWFATSCTPDIRLFGLDLVNSIALAASKVAESAFHATCQAAGFVTFDLAQGAIAASALPGQGQLRVPTARTDSSLSQMNNYVFGARQDATRTGTSDGLYVLDGVSGDVFVLSAPGGVNGFTDASVQQIPELNALLAQTIDRTAGDQGLILFNLDQAKAVNLPVPDGFTAVSGLADGAAVCCLATRKLVGRALKQGGSSAVIYDLVTGDIAVVPNPEGVTSVGPPPAANGANAALAARLIVANSRANTVAAVAYRGGNQVGILVVRVP